MAFTRSFFQRGAAGPCAPARLPDLALPGRLARAVLPARALSTQAGDPFSRDAIPGGRGGPQSVAPFLPVGFPGGGGRRPGLFRGRL